MTNDDISFEISDADIADSRILVVDDEELVTSSLRNLLFLDLDIDPITFNSPREALSYLETNPIDLVISDFLMPDLDGISLLAGSRKVQPEVPRILLTGYADKENAIRAINEVQLFQYVQKPWDNEQLRQVIRNGLERLYLIRSLTTYVKKLSSTEANLNRLRKGLMRAFA